LVARQFDTRPDLVASTLLLTTLGSILTISVVLGLLL
jgi:predicted permease